ncbi:hypothetical protein GRW71_01915 [Escherichia coli]|nr:hypothetical protein [Escherichia coli]MWJ69288.1 hypothetical protein [Escherichia coli]MWJ73729.1 hypothetical protein [Escherichia coli]MWK41074.1 hypothetical protein [Escherichia coli]MWK50222.1 hypothetical protein [Escherichia coli]
MAKNDFKAFATDRNANVMSQEEWEALPALLSGFTAGKASSAQVNKVIRQASFIAAALAQFVSDKTQRDVLDNGDLPGFVELLGSGFAVEYLSRKNPFGDIKSDGTVKTALENLGLGDASGYVGRLLNIQVFTASGTVTKTPGAKKWRIKCLGAGGGSSAAPATGSNEVSVSNGGGAGAYAEGIYDVSSITTASVVIGSGGAGGTADSIYGADGGTSSVGSFISSPGGKAGLPAGPANPPFQPVANTNSDGSTGWNIVGSSGAGAEPAVAVTYNYATGSRGSNSIFGVGGSIPAINSPANPGGGYGSGASGCSNGPSQSAKSGAAGRSGIVIIEEYA